jgi:hypothetical protein
MKPDVAKRFATDIANKKNSHLAEREKNNTIPSVFPIMHCSKQLNPIPSLIILT